MNILSLTAAAIVYVAIGALVGLLGKHLLEERGIGTEGNRDTLGVFMTFLWPLYAAIYLVWQASAALFGSRLLPNLAGFTFKTFVLVIGGVVVSLALSVYFLARRRGSYMPEPSMRPALNTADARTPLRKK